MSFFVELGTGLAANLIGKQIEQRSIRIGARAKEIYDRVKEGSLGIFILGPQGTGKTTALGVLSGQRQINDLPSEYASSAGNEASRYKGHLFFQVHAGPGQETLADAHWPKLFDKASKFRRPLFVFCVSYGYHALFEEDFEQIATDSVYGSERLVVKDYLERQRALESATFERLCTELGAIQGKIGLLLLVTKQDLWWNDRQEVAAHYASGAFANGFRRLKETKKSVGFVEARQSASLSIQNLLTSDRRLIASTTSGYDQLVQRANYLNFLNGLEMAVGKLTE